MNTFDRIMRGLAHYGALPQMVVLATTQNVELPYEHVDAVIKRLAEKFPKKDREDLKVEFKEVATKFPESAVRFSSIVSSFVDHGLPTFAIELATLFPPESRSDLHLTIVTRILEMVEVEDDDEILGEITEIPSGLDAKMLRRLRSASVTRCYPKLAQMIAKTMGVPLTEEEIADMMAIPLKWEGAYVTEALEVAEVRGVPLSPGEITTLLDWAFKNDDWEDVIKLIKHTKHVLSENETKRLAACWKF